MNRLLPILATNMNTTPNKNISRDFKLTNAETSEYIIRDIKSVPNPLAIMVAISF